MIPPERLKKGIDLFNAGGVTHKIGDLYSVSTRGGHYEVYANPSRWSCNCTWGAVHAGSWVLGAGPCYHAIAAAALGDFEIPLAPPEPDPVPDDDDPFVGLS